MEEREGWDGQGGDGEEDRTYGRTEEGRMGKEGGRVPL